MTISKKLSETEVMFSKHIASCYLSVLKAEGLCGLMNLVTDRYHVDKVYDEYAGFCNSFSNGDPVLRCDTERYVKIAMEFVMDRVAFHVNSEYYVGFYDFKNSECESLVIRDDSGIYHAFNEVDLSEI